MKKVTVLGGGTGNYVVLTALKQIENINRAAIVTMMDNGGSTGRLRDQLGVLPPGDLRQCLVALSDASDLWRKLFTYRFVNGDLKGHSFGNIMLSALEKVSGSYDEGLKEAHRLMHCAGRVIPVTLQKTDIEVTYADGTISHGEALLDEGKPAPTSIVSSRLDPAVEPYDNALKRIRTSDYIIVGPGDLYASLIPVALVERVADTFAKSKGTFIYICNLMTKSSQTYDYTASDHVRDIAQYFKRQPDIVIVNSAPIPPNLLGPYHEFNDKPIIDDLADSSSMRVIRDDLLDTGAHEADSSESLGKPFAHSFIRHSSEKLYNLLCDILKED